MTTKTEAAPKQSVLPTTKTPPRFGLSNGKTLLYGPVKAGKTTLASQIAPDTTLFLATEPGQGALEAFVQPIRDWTDFLIALDALKSEQHNYRLVVVDTVDELVRMCADHVVRALSGPNVKATDFVHASDHEYGKGWDAVAQEFRLRVGALCHAVPGVILIAHQDEGVVKQRNGLEVSKIKPKIGMKGVRTWLLGYVDYIFAAQIIQTADGDQRILQLKPTETVEAGARIPDELQGKLPDAIPLKAASLIATFQNLNKQSIKKETP